MNFITIFMHWLGHNNTTSGVWDWYTLITSSYFCRSFPLHIYIYETVLCDITANIYKEPMCEQYSEDNVNSAYLRVRH